MILRRCECLHDRWDEPRFFWSPLSPISCELYSYYSFINNKIIDINRLYQEIIRFLGEYFEFLKMEHSRILGFYMFLS